MQINANAMMAMSNWMNNSAHNVSNVNTDNFKAVQTTITDAQGTNSPVAQNRLSQNGTDLATEMTDQIGIDKSFEANADTIKTQDEMIGTLLDMKA